MVCSLFMVAILRQTWYICQVISGLKQGVYNLLEIIREPYGSNICQNISMLITPEMNEELKQIACECDSTKSEVVRYALNLFIDDYCKKCAALLESKKD